MERFVISLVDDDGLVVAIIFEWSALKVVLLSGVFSLSIECSMIVRFVLQSIGSIRSISSICDDE